MSQDNFGAPFLEFRGDILCFNSARRHTEIHLSFVYNKTGKKKQTNPVVTTPNHSAMSSSGPSKRNGISHHSLSSREA